MKLAVEGRGSVKLKIGGITQVVTNVFYVPDLISIGQLQEKGHLKVIFEDKQCKVYHKERGLIITSVMTRNRMFVIKGQMIPLAITCLNVEHSDLSHLWHCRFGHLSQKGLKTLVQRDMVKGLPKL